MGTVLVVEDDIAFLELLRYILTREGYQVRCATDGKEALGRWREAAPDLILLDIGLPRIRGFDVCREIRAQVQTPIILFSTCAGEEVTVRGLEAGADACVTKPFSFRQLTERIAATLAPGTRVLLWGALPLLAGMGSGSVLA